MRVFVWIGLTSLFLAACEAQIPAPPPVTVVVQSVDYQSALADGVALALTATAQEPVAATETALARLGVSLTPSLTPSATPTPLPPTPTTPVTPTRPPPPSITPSATYPSLPLNAVNITGLGGTAGQVRVLNAWPNTAFDVYLNDVRVSRLLPFAGMTPYHQIENEAVRVTVSANAVTVGQVIAVPSGGSVSVVVADFGDGITLRPVYEDVSMLPMDSARLTLLQANPDLVLSDVLFPQLQRAFTYNLEVSGQAGPVDLPSTAYRLEFYDSSTPDSLLGALSELRLDSQVNHLLVLLSPPQGTAISTNYVLFKGGVPGQASVQLVNGVGQPLFVQLNEQMQAMRLDAGSLSVPLPLPPTGTKLTLADEAGNILAEHDVTPAGDDQLWVLYKDEDTGEIQVDAFSQRTPTSMLNSHLRLINALPDITALSMEWKLTSAAVSETTADSSNWSVLLDSIPYGQESDYVGLGTQLYDVRVTLAGTDTVIAALPQIQLLGGSIYDFVVVPGSESGSVRLLVAQPNVQTGPSLGQLDPLVLEQVRATLTALVPAPVTVVSDTPSPSPTMTPVFTNTPHPTNTPSFLKPTLLIDPTAPDVATGSFVLLGLNLVPRADYVVSLVPSERTLLRGITDSNGTLVADIILPANMPDGFYIIRVCVDCTASGAQQEVFAVINAVFPTPSPTPRISPTRTPTAGPGLSPTPTAPPAGTRPTDEPGGPSATPRPGATAVPTTVVPPTAIPPTVIPPTVIPPTVVPPTPVPPTPVPPTPVPPTPVPPTPIPPTDPPPPPPTDPPPPPPTDPPPPPPTDPPPPPPAPPPVDPPPIDLPVLPPIDLPPLLPTGDDD